MSIGSLRRSPARLGRRPVGRSLLTTADWSATLLFAVEGAFTAAAHHVNYLGVLAVGLASAPAGGIVRDLVLGDTPPAAFRNNTYVYLALAGGLMVLALDRTLATVPRAMVTVVDSLGLGLFAVVGSAKALTARVPHVAAILLGTLSAIGGGVLRDVLLNQVPAVMGGQIYASAACLGASVCVLTLRCGGSRSRALVSGFLACTLLRLLAVANGWALPIVDT